MQRHQSFVVGAIVILFASVDLSLQQTCLSSQFQCTTGSQCVAQTDACDYYKDCRDNSDESSCPFAPVDYTKALVVLFANQFKSPPLGITVLYGNPANYVPSLGLRPSYPWTNLSLPINFRSSSFNQYNYVSTMDVNSYSSVLFFANGANTRIEWGSMMLLSTLTNTYISAETTSSQVAAIAYDWVSKNVYWLDAGNQWIKVATTAQTGSTLYTRTIVKNIVNPRDIAVDPINAILFWISGTCGSAQIMRSPLNGSDPTPLALTPSPSSNCPTKLAIDVNARILYWLDASNTRVGYATYSSSSDAVAYWYTSSDFADMSSMTLFGNYVVLGSMTRRTVNFYRRGTMALEGLMTPFYSPALDYPLMDIATYDITNQPTSGSSSPCASNNGGCSQLCFSTSPSSSICGCKTNQKLSSEGSTTCVNGQTTNKAYNTVICAAAGLAYLLMIL